MSLELDSSFLIKVLREAEVLHPPHWELEEWREQVRAAIEFVSEHDVHLGRLRPPDQNWLQERNEFCRKVSQILIAKGLDKTSLMDPKVMGLRYELDLILRCMEFMERYEVQDLKRAFKKGLKKGKIPIANLRDISPQFANFYYTFLNKFARTEDPELVFNMKEYILELFSRIFSLKLGEEVRFHVKFFGAPRSDKARNTLLWFRELQSGDATAINPHLPQAMRVLIPEVKAEVEESPLPKNETVAPSPTLSSVLLPKKKIEEQAPDHQIASIQSRMVELNPQFMELDDAAFAQLVVQAACRVYSGGGDGNKKDNTYSLECLSRLLGRNPNYVKAELQLCDEEVEPRRLRRYWGRLAVCMRAKGI